MCARLQVLRFRGLATLRASVSIRRAAAARIVAYYRAYRERVWLEEKATVRVRVLAAFCVQHQSMPCASGAHMQEFVRLPMRRAYYRARTRILQRVHHGEFVGYTMKVQQHHIAVRSCMVADTHFRLARQEYLRWRVAVRLQRVARAKLARMAVLRLRKASSQRSHNARNYSDAVLSCRLRCALQQDRSACRIQKCFRRSRFQTALNRVLGLGAATNARRGVLACVCAHGALMHVGRVCAVRVARLVSAIWPSKAPYVVHPVPTSAPAHEIEVARLINRRARAVHTLVPWYRAVKVAWRLLKRAQSEFVAIGMQEERALGAVGLQVWCYQHARLCTNDVLPRQRVWRGWAERRHMRGLRSRLRWARKRDAVARRREHILHEFRFRGRLRSFNRPGKRKVKCRTFASCALRIVVFNYICRRLFGLRKARGTASPRRHA